jgi:hypothetical protein
MRRAIAPAGNVIAGLISSPQLWRPQIAARRAHLSLAGLLAVAQAVIALAGDL